MKTRWNTKRRGRARRLGGRGTERPHWRGGWCAVGPRNQTGQAKACVMSGHNIGTMRLRIVRGKDSSCAGSSAITHDDPDKRSLLARGGVRMGGDALRRCHIVPRALPCGPRCDPPHPTLRWRGLHR